jgi:hypothetical protein
VPASRLPAHDPQEPNDNISWVDGRAFGAPADPVWGGGPPTRFDAQLDKEEDPYDVYRVVIPAHGKAKVSAVPRFGDVQLEVFNAKAFSIFDDDNRIVHSHRAGAKRTEHATFRNTSAKPRTLYVTVRPQGRSRYQDRRYTLRVG